MQFSKLQLNVRSFLDKKHFFLIAYFCFLLGFFVVPSTHWHNNFFYVFLLFPYLITFRTKNIRIFRRSKIWILSLVLAGYMCLTLLWADNSAAEDYIYYLRRPVYIFVFLSLTIELVRKYPKFTSHLFVLLCWVASITGVASAVWFYSSHSFPTARLAHFGDQLRNAVAGGNVYGMMAIICCFYVLKRREAHTAIYTGILSVIFFSAVLTWSRAPLAALFGTLLIAGIIARDKTVIGIVSVFTIIGVLMYFHVEGVKETIFRAGAWFVRKELWEQSLVRVWEAPFFGEGISANRRFTISDGSTWNHSHNVYIATALYGGLTGLFLFLAVILVGVWQSILCFHRQREVTYVALLVYACACMMFANHRVISHPDAIWLYFWLPLAILAAKEISNYKDRAGIPSKRVECVVPERG